MKISPLIAACVLLLVAAVLFVAGVHVLAGTGWALLAAVVPCVVLGFVLLRGALRAMVEGNARA